MPYRASGADARTVSMVALLLSFASCVAYAEAVLLPSLPIPGVRLGFANIAVVVAILVSGSRSALVVSVGRVLIVALATGALGGPSFLLSIAGALAAWATMSMLASRGAVFSPIGWSVAGSAVHVVTQLVVASWIVGSTAPLLMLPLSLGASLPAGLAVGYSAGLLVSRIPETTLVFGH